MRVFLSRSTNFAMTLTRSDNFKAYFKEIQTFEKLFHKVTMPVLNSAIRLFVINQHQSNFTKMLRHNICTAKVNLLITTSDKILK